MRSISIRLGIIAVIVVAVSSCGVIGGNAGNLSVGDCFDQPTGATDTVKDVEHHPCTDVHTAEVVFVGDYGPATDTYPSDEDFLTFFNGSCTAAFNAFTGLDFVTDQTYDMSAFTPTSDGWGDGDHKVICYAVRLDSGTMNQSIKKS
jgi:hypothetical protein